VCRNTRVCRINDKSRDGGGLPETRGKPRLPKKQLLYGRFRNLAGKRKPRIRWFTGRWRGARTNGVRRATKCLLAAAAQHLTRAKLVTTDTYGSARPTDDARAFSPCTHTHTHTVVWTSKRRLNRKKRFGFRRTGERFFADDTAVLVRERSRVARRVDGEAKHPKVT